jgi:hypothetical protein
MLHSRYLFLDLFLVVTDFSKTRTPRRISFSTSVLERSFDFEEE